MLTTVLFILGMAGFLLIYVISIFNRLVTLKNRVANAFSQIDVQLKRRYDLIPNLVETAKGYLKHERDTLESVISARNEALSGLKAAELDPSNPLSIQHLVSAESSLSSALGRFSAVIEAYPDLKANQNMLQLTEELTSTENRIAFSRQAFNDSVTMYNEYKQSFPSVLFASSFGHTQDASLLEFEDRDLIKNIPDVEF